MAVAADDDIGLRCGSLLIRLFVVFLFWHDGRIVDLAGYNSIVVALGNDKLQGVIAAAHIVYAGQLDYHTFIGAAYCPFFNFSTGAGASQEAAVTRGGNREIILVVAGGATQAQKVIISNIQGQINIVALYDLRAGIDLIQRGAGIFGVLFVIGHVLVIHLPVVAAAANSIQPETVSGLFAAQGALGLEYRGDGCIASQSKFTVCFNIGCSFTNSVIKGNQFISGFGFSQNSNLGAFCNGFRYGAGGERGLGRIVLDGQCSIFKASGCNGICIICGIASIGAIRLVCHRHGAQHHGQHQNKCQDLAYLFHSHTPPWPAASVLSVKCSFSGSSSAGAAGGS